MDILEKDGDDHGPIFCRTRARASRHVLNPFTMLGHRSQLFRSCVRARSDERAPTWPSFEKRGAFQNGGFTQRESEGLSHGRLAHRPCYVPWQGQGTGAGRCSLHSSGVPRLDVTTALIRPRGVWTPAAPRVLAVRAYSINNIVAKHHTYHPRTGAQ